MEASHPNAAIVGIFASGFLFCETLARFRLLQVHHMRRDVGLYAPPDYIYSPFTFKLAFLLFFRISKCSAPLLAFASARFMALRRLVAGRALEFEDELCCICI